MERSENKTKETKSLKQRGFRLSNSAATRMSGLQGYAGNSPTHSLVKGSKEMDLVKNIN